MDKTLKVMLSYYVTSIILGLAMSVMGVYAFITVYGWTTFLGMLGIALILQAWYWISMYHIGKNEEAEKLEAAVGRAQREE